MRRLLPCLCLVLFWASASFAQDRDYPKFDFTAAVTFNYFETPAPSSRHTLHGFTYAAAANFKEWAAVEADVTYTRKTIGGIRRSLLTYAVGPRFTRRRENSNLEPYVHALIGGGHLTGFPLVPGGFPNVTDGWSGKFGGGLDVKAGQHVAIRVIGVDYYRYHGHIPTGRQRLDNAAFSFGIRLF
jgi:hypothetical protein